MAIQPAWADDLDPGIRDTVLLLHNLGFRTSDSGDGVSKPKEWFDSGEALPFPHIVATTTDAFLFTEADRMADVLGPEWVVEASYSVRDKSCILFARKADH